MKYPKYIVRIGNSVEYLEDRNHIEDARRQAIEWSDGQEVAIYQLKETVSDVIVKRQTIVKKANA